MSYAVHTKGHSGLAILVFLAFLALLVVVLIFFSHLVTFPLFLWNFDGPLSLNPL